ncbi:hypothetical protein ESZ50_07405 [Weissella muntiaci]|uniref:Uncharacterized protein n=1 Tax=Weissella muntiaci TaxID=2508881 RepID=A0A6C2C584_9LACO|nr:hypothetical protein [Weissella muntiaci]TYC49064.1 hypothetical protein ESZ50_07405 [Weissella muntiaci]
MRHGLFNASSSEAKQLFGEPIMLSFKTWQDDQRGKEVGIIGTVIFLMIIFAVGEVIPLGSRMLLNSKGDSINLIPTWLYIVLFLTMLLVIIISNHFVRGKKLEFYQGQWFFFNYGLIILVEMNLFFGTLFIRDKQILIMALLLAINLLVFIIIFIRLSFKILNLMYGMEKIRKTRSKFKKFLSKYWWSIFSIYILTRIFFNSLGVLPILIVWVLTNFIISLFLLEVSFMATVQGYYKIKYFDEYEKNDDNIETLLN